MIANTYIAISIIWIRKINARSIYIINIQNLFIDDALSQTRKNWKDWINTTSSFNRLKRQPKRTWTICASKRYIILQTNWILASISRCTKSLKKRRTCLYFYSIQTTNRRTEKMTLLNIRFAIPRPLQGPFRQHFGGGNRVRVDRVLPSIRLDDRIRFLFIRLLFIASSSLGVARRRIWRR